MFGAVCGSETNGRSQCHSAWIAGGPARPYYDARVPVICHGDHAITVDREQLEGIMSGGSDLFTQSAGPKLLFCSITPANQLVHRLDRQQVGAAPF